MYYKILKICPSSAWFSVYLLGIAYYNFNWILQDFLQVITQIRENWQIYLHMRLIAAFFKSLYFVSSMLLIGLFDFCDFFFPVTSFSGVLETLSTKSPFWYFWSELSTHSLTSVHLLLFTLWWITWGLGRRYLMIKEKWTMLDRRKQN